MGMACYQGMAGRFGIVVQPAFGFILKGVIFGGAGGVEHAEAFQGLPKISHKEAGKTPAGRIQKISLVAMGKVEAVILTGIFQNYPLIKGNTGKQGLHTLGLCAEVSGTAGIPVPLFFLFHIMVPVKHI